MNCNYTCVGMGKSNIKFKHTHLFKRSANGSNKFKSATKSTIQIKTPSKSAITINSYIKVISKINGKSAGMVEIIGMIKLMCQFSATS